MAKATINVKVLLLASIVLCLGTILTTYLANRQRDKARFWVDHTYEVIRACGTLTASYKDLEIGAKSFSTTPDTSFYKFYSEAANLTRISLRTLRDLTLDNPAQTEVIDQELSTQIENRVNSINQSIIDFRSTGNKIPSDHALDQTIRVQELIKKIESRENELLSQRSATLHTLIRLCEGSVYLSAILIAATIVLAFLTISRMQKHNRQLLSHLQHANQSLESRVAEQTHEILTSNKNLQKQNDELAALNEELRASEEKIKSQFNFISTLQLDLEKSEKLHRSLTENSQDMIALFSLDNRFEYVSPSVTTILGYKPEELIGTSGNELLHPDDVALLAPAAGLDSTKNSSSNIPHFRLRRKNGSYVWIESQSNAITNEDGKIIAIQTINRDITERKQNEIALKQAKEKAEEATIAKSQFLSMMSHEIRTPMNAVIGLTHILLDSGPREDQVESLKLLQFSGENLLAIINDILDFSKIEAGKIHLESIPFNFYELLDNTVSVQRSRAEHKGIKLHYRFDKNLPHFYNGDPVRINQVVTNLIGNAIKFTEKGYVEISVDGHAVGGNRYTLEVSVKDSGIGIPPDKLGYIFERFSQASSDTTRKFGGTGLGLAITKKLTEMMHGTISVQSVYGYGSTFKITLDIEASEETILDKPTSTAQSIYELQDPSSRILVAEDNRVNQIVLSNFLEKWGLQADFVMNGLEALEKIQTTTYKLVLMDLQMPEMDGYTASKAIRNLDGHYYQDVPIIALTASAMVEIKEKAAEYGMNDYISKPFSPDELKEKIFKLINMPDVEPLFERSYLRAFNLYTEGNAELKREMAELLIKDIVELQSSVNILQVNGDKEKFIATLHKVKTTLSFLDDKEFNRILQHILEALETNSSLNGDIEQFHSVSGKLIEGLKEETLL
jgi:PAS domain S-box-containing protein